MTESETAAALRRAASRAGFHILRAAVESLKALEVFVDELSSVGHNQADKPEGGARRERIDIE